MTKLLTPHDGARPAGLCISDGAPDAGGGSGSTRAVRALYQPISPGSWHRAHMFTAPSDGFVLCTIAYPPSHNSGCVCWGYISFGWSAQTTGGNVATFGHNWTEYMANNPNSCCHPVDRWDQFRIGVMQNTGAGQQVDAPYNFWWISLTGERIGGYEVVDTNVGNRAIDPDFAPPPLPQVGPQGAQDRQAFVAILERLLGKPIDAQTQNKFLALSRMA